MNPLYSANDTNRIFHLDKEPDEKIFEYSPRGPFRRDNGRLIHSAAFRRLQGKTQLFPNYESDFFRNRLSHSIEVAQIAKGIAEEIKTMVILER